MTWQHGAVIIFALAIVAYCGRQAMCHDVMPQLSTLAATAIGGVLGNAMAEIKHRRSKKPEHHEERSDAGK